MSKERELLGRWHNGDLLPEEYMALMKETKELLAQPEPIKEREVSGKIISTDDACNWNLTVDALKDYDHVYVNGIRYTEYQPDINTQYLLDQVSRLTAENAMIKEKWSEAQPEQEPVAWMWKKHTAGGWLDAVGLDKPSATAHQINIYPLYTAQPKREPLSDEDIGKGFLLTDVWHRYECFIAGVKFAEKMHGIGGEE